MLEDILLQHFDRYPKMEPQDAVKLVYQHTFGPGHLIRDEKKVLAFLQQELAGAGEPLPGEALYESIGNGLCRLNLRPCAERGIPAEDIARLFLETAQAASGDKKSFRQGLKALQKLAEAGETPFDAVELDLFLARYPDSCPAVHHSVSYHLAYAPAYRVVAQKKVKDYLAGRRNSQSS